MPSTTRRSLLAFFGMAAVLPIRAAAAAPAPPATLPAVPQLKLIVGQIMPRISHSFRTDPRFAAIPQHNSPVEVVRLVTYVIWDGSDWLDYESVKGRALAERLAGFGTGST